MANDSGIWREAMNEHRPDYILAIRARALDRVQELIEPHENDDVPPPEVWRSIVEAAFPPPPMAGRPSSENLLGAMRDFENASKKPDHFTQTERPYEPLHTMNPRNPDGHDLERIIVRFAPRDRSGFVRGVCLLGCLHDCPRACPCECHRPQRFTAAD